MSTSLQEILQPSITKISWKITFLKFISQGPISQGPMSWILSLTCLTLYKNRFMHPFMKDHPWCFNFFIILWNVHNAGCWSTWLIRLLFTFAGYHDRGWGSSWWKSAYNTLWHRYDEVYLLWVLSGSVSSGCHCRGMEVFIISLIFRLTKLTNWGLNKISFSYCILWPESWLKSLKC